MGCSERRVFVRVKGGIGNQLFQFAYALLLAGGCAANVRCVLDHFRRDSKHGGFALGQLLGPEVRTVDAVAPGSRIVYVNADQPADEDLSGLAETRFDLLLDGYFQNVRNVLPVLDIVKQLFRAQFDADRFVGRLIAHVADLPHETLVAIHLRRGDYLEPKTRQVHGVPTVQSIVNCLNQMHPRPSAAFLFSDSGISIDLPCHKIDFTGRDGSLSQDVDQFRLMSCCNAIIASNSTFSYWAGLLSHRAEQVLIPDPWMRSGTVRTAALLTDGIRSYPTELD
jgi:hypothetical protein